MVLSANLLPAFELENWEHLSPVSMSPVICLVPVPAPSPENKDGPSLQIQSG